MTRRIRPKSVSAVPAGRVRDSGRAAGPAPAADSPSVPVVLVWSAPATVVVDAVVSPA
jgi:hypothetical protein